MNDLWRFDLVTQTVDITQWSEVVCSGELPPLQVYFSWTTYTDSSGDIKLVVGYGHTYKAYSTDLHM